MDKERVASELLKVAQELVANEFESEFVKLSDAFQKEVKSFDKAVDKYLAYLKKNERSLKILMDRSGGSVAAIENLIRRVGEKPLEMKELMVLLKKVKVV